MRRSNVLVLTSLLVSAACAQGEDIVSTGTYKFNSFDAGHGPEASAGGISYASGGSVSSSGGAPSSGGFMPSAGGAIVGGRPGSGGIVTAGGMGSGGRASGGAMAAGGKVSSGGSAPMQDGGSCKTGEKFCGGICTPPAPRGGRGTTGCMAWAVTAPGHGYLTCTSRQRPWDCLSGYKKN